MDELAAVPSYQVNRLTEIENGWPVLARYNAEVARGLVHTREWRDEMRELQAIFDQQHRPMAAPANARKRRTRWWTR